MSCAGKRHFDSKIPAPALEPDSLKVTPAPTQCYTVLVAGGHFGWQVRGQLLILPKCPQILKANEGTEMGRSVQPRPPWKSSFRPVPDTCGLLSSWPRTFVPSWLWAKCLHEVPG